MSNRKSYIDSLIEELNQISIELKKLVNASEVVDYNSESRNVYFSPGYGWKKLEISGDKIRIGLAKRTRIWAENVLLVINEAPYDIVSNLKRALEYIQEVLIERSAAPPGLKPEIEKELEENLKQICDALKLYANNDTEIIIVPDTNALIHEIDPDKYKGQVESESFTVIYVPTIFKELDKLKNDQDNDAREKAKKAIKRLKGYRIQSGDILRTGVKLNKTITIKFFAKEPKGGQTLSWLDLDNNDDRIIAGVLEVQIQFPASICHLMTADVNLQNKAVMAGLSFVEPPKGEGDD